MRRCFPIVVVSLFVLSGCQGQRASKTPPAAAPEYRLNATIKDIMDSFVDPGADYIWDAVSTTVTAKGSVESTLAPMKSGKSYAGVRSRSWKAGTSC